MAVVSQQHRMAAGTSPSPILPTLLLVILGIMVLSSGSMRQDYYMTRTVNPVQEKASFTAILIPVVLVIAVQAFGMPHKHEHNPRAFRRSSVLAPSVTLHNANRATDIALLLVIVLVIYIILIGFSSNMDKTWRPPQGYYPTRRNWYYGSRKARWPSTY